MTDLENDALFAAGTIRAELVTSPADEQPARNAVLAEIAKLSKDGLSAEEVAVSGALSTTMKLMALQAQRNRVLEYARAVISQRQASDVDAFSERLSKITTDDIKRAAATYLKPAGSSAGVVRATQPAQPQTTKD
jgi:predicted Zn-dependent peptidase